MNNTEFCNIDTQYYAEEVTKTVYDISTEKEIVFAFAEQDGYRKKIELIFAAEDMTTREKIEAINRAEDRRIREIQKSVDVCKELMWNRYLLSFLCLTGIVLLAATPEGNKSIKRVLKSIA